VSQNIEVHRLGLVEYQTCLDLQKRFHQEVSQNQRPDTLIVVEHPNVITLGRHASLNHLSVSRESLQAGHIDLVMTDRGGDITAHEPGQIVLYPIFSLQQGKGPRNLVSWLESTVISLLDDYGIPAVTRREYPGVWVEDERGFRKIASLGLRIQNRVSYHGLALNVMNSLMTFDLMNPCGIESCIMTSMQRECGFVMDYHDIEEQLVEEFLARMDIMAN
jgi:lipoyl(octanoyl) transferase